MLGFEYIYLSPDTIIWHILSKESTSGEFYVIIIWIIVFVWALVYYILPSIFIRLEYRKTQKTKKTQKEALTKIMLQKDIEEEIEREIRL